MVQYRYVCTCAVGWHDTPFCPYRRPQQPPRQITAGEMRTLRYLRQLEREGKVPALTQPLFSWRFRLYFMLAIAVFIVLVIVI